MSGRSRQVTVAATSASDVLEALRARLPADDLRLVLVFADWHVDPVELVRGLERAFAAPSVGCSTVGIVGAGPGHVTAVGFYGDAVRAGIGVASELSSSPLSRSLDAMHQATRELGTTTEALDPARHVALTFVVSNSDTQEAFCIGTAAASPQIRVVGGGASTEHASSRQTYVWARGTIYTDAGIVVMLETDLPFEALTSSHLLLTDARTVVTAASGRVIEELDGVPASSRVHALFEQLGGAIDPIYPSEYSFARIIEGKPYVRSLAVIDGTRVRLASSVEPGHILHVMRPGDLIEQTRRDLAAAAERVGGRVSTLLAFSCLARHWEANAKGLARELMEVFAAYPVTGFQSHGEQSGTLLINHSLTGLVIGEAP